MKSKFKEIGCEFKNEIECEEELNEMGIEVNDAEAFHYEED